MNSIRSDNLSTTCNVYKINNNKVDYAIFSAIPEELNFIISKFSDTKVEGVSIGEFEFFIYHYNNTKILIASCGLGTTFAACMLTLVHSHFHPEYVLFSGVAGGIDSRIKIRDVVIAENAFEAEIQGAFVALKNTPFEDCLTHPCKKLSFPSKYSCDKSLLQIVKEIHFPENINIHFGDVVTSNTFPAPVDLYKEINGQKAISIDMETSAFYQVAWLLNIPILAIRGISNTLDEHGTDKDVHLSDLKGSAEAAGKVLIQILDTLIIKHKLHYGDTTLSNEIEELITQFKLQPHPEGGYYARNFASSLEVKSYDPDRYNGESRKAGTSIYYLLRGNDFSAFHILKSDEIWHFYNGSTVALHMIDTEGTLTSYLLGDPKKLTNAAYQVTIPAGNWFAAEVIEKNSFSFVGCTVSPGFEFKDFTLADRDSLCAQYPVHSEIIKTFTRKEHNYTQNLNIKNNTTQKH